MEDVVNSNESKSLVTDLVTEGAKIFVVCGYVYHVPGEPVQFSIRHRSRCVRILEWSDLQTLIWVEGKVAALSKEMS